MSDLTYTQTKGLIAQLGRDKVVSLIKQHSIEMLVAACELSIMADSIEDSYRGFSMSDKEFVQDMLYETDSETIFNLPSIINIDWEGTTIDVMMDYSEHNGHYFRA